MNMLHVTPPSDALSNKALLGEDEKALVVHYMKSAPLIMRSSGLVHDQTDPGHPRVVPSSIRGDGEWIWPDAATYYFENYNAVLPAEFVAHIRETVSPPEQLDAEVIRISIETIQRKK